MPWSDPFDLLEDCQLIAWLHGNWILYLFTRQVNRIDALVIWKSNNHTCHSFHFIFFSRGRSTALFCLAWTHKEKMIMNWMAYPLHSRSRMHCSSDTNPDFYDWKNCFWNIFCYTLIYILQTLQSPIYSALQNYSLSHFIEVTNSGTLTFVPDEVFEASNMFLSRHYLYFQPSH